MYSPTRPRGRASEEGYAPAPRAHGRLGEGGRQKRRKRRAQQETSNGGEQQPAHVKPRRRSGAYSARNVAAPPYSPPVEKPWRHREQEQKQGRPETYLRVPGKDSDEEGRDRHEDDDGREGALTSDPVPHRPENQPAQGARKEGHGEDRKRVQAAPRSGRPTGRKRRLCGGEEGVDGEVEPLHAVAHRGPDRGPSHHLLIYLRYRLPYVPIPPSATSYPCSVSLRTTPRRWPAAIQGTETSGYLCPPVRCVSRTNHTTC